MRTLSTRRFAVLASRPRRSPAHAQLTLVGEWAGRYHEDQGDRVPGDVQGDFTGVPLNDAARRYAEAFDVTRVAVLEHQCQPYNVAHIYRGPIQFRVWEDKNPATQEIIAYRQLQRHVHAVAHDLDGRPPASARARAAHAHGLLDGRVARRHPHGHDDAHQERVLPPQRHPEQRPDDARRALHPSRQRAVARHDHHGPRVSHGAVRHERGVRAHGARQPELALQLRVRHGSADGQERRAVLSAGHRIRSSRTTRSSTVCRSKPCSAARRRSIPSTCRRWNG